MPDRPLSLYIYLYMYTYVHEHIGLYVYTYTIVFNIFSRIVVNKCLIAK